MNNVEKWFHHFSNYCGHRFADQIDKFVTFGVKFFDDAVYQKLFKIFILTELLKKM